MVILSREKSIEDQIQETVLGKDITPHVVGEVGPIPQVQRPPPRQIVAATTLLVEHCSVTITSINETIGKLEATILELIERREKLYNARELSDQFIQMALHERESSERVQGLTYIDTGLRQP